MKDPIALKRKNSLIALGLISLFVLVAILLYYFFYMPSLAELSRLKMEVEEREQGLEKEVEAQSLAITTAKKEIDRWKSRVKELNRRLPDKEDFEHLLLDIGNLADRNHLKEFHLTVIPRQKGNGGVKGGKQGNGPRVAGTETSGDGEKKGEVAGRDALPVSSVGISISFHSYYRDMARFLSSLTDSMRAMSFDTLEIKGREDKMVTTLLIKAYYRSESAETTHQ